MNAVAQYILVGRSIWEILDALEDLNPTNPGISGDWTSLISDAKVVAFLRMTVANTCQILFILHRND